MAGRANVFIHIFANSFTFANHFSSTSTRSFEGTFFGINATVTGVCELFNLEVYGSNDVSKHLIHICVGK